MEIAQFKEQIEAAALKYLPQLKVLISENPRDDANHLMTEQVFDAYEAETNALVSQMTKQQLREIYGDVLPGKQPKVDLVDVLIAMDLEKRGALN